MKGEIGDWKQGNERSRERMRKPMNSGLPAFDIPDVEHVPAQSVSECVRVFRDPNDRKIKGLKSFRGILRPKFCGGSYAENIKQNEQRDPKEAGKTQGLLGLLRLSPFAHGLSVAPSIV